jgi:hypothetical protein
MRYKFLLWLLLTTVTCSGQIAGVISAGSSNRNSGSSPEKTYVSPSAAPSFSSPVTITDAVGSSLESGEISGASDILVNENATPGLFNNRLRPNGISSKRFKSSGSSRIFIGGDNVTSGMQVIAPLNGSDNLSYYHVGIVGNSDDGQDGVSGVNHLASVSGTTVTVEDVIIRNVEFAGVLMNEGTSGEKYNSITLNFVRVFGYPVEGEGFYIGSTNKLSSFSTISLLEMSHCYVYNKLREGLQLTHIADGINAECAKIEHFTAYTVGQTSLMPEQQYLLQVHNSNGYIKKSIFHKGTRPINIFTHGFVFEDCYFEWDTNDPIYMGRLEAGDAFGSSAIAGNGQPIVFRRCIFNPSVNVDELIRILETDCNITFEDCYFSNRIAGGVAGNLISDERGSSPTNTISNTGYTIGPPLASPEYINHDPLDPDAGKVTSDFYYDLGLGYLTPDPE